jgi:choline dehydrogenase-like flavoprotein
VSRGQVALASTDPGEAPAIRAGYLSEDADVRLLVRWLRMAREIAAHPALQAFGDVAEQAPTAGAQTDAEIAAALCEVAQTIYHPAGTCRMGAGAGSVVDPELRVRGVAGLRIADASIMPTLVRAHPQAAIYALAERAAEIPRAPARVLAGAG